jgi:hypothetical protein
VQVDKALRGTLSSVVPSAAGFQAQREAVAEAVGRSRASAAEAAAAALLEARLSGPDLGLRCSCSQVCAWKQCPEQTLTRQAADFGSSPISSTAAQQLYMQRACRSSCIECHVTRRVFRRLRYPGGPFQEEQSSAAAAAARPRHGGGDTQQPQGGKRKA